jgi:hypothetical protein
MAANKAAKLKEQQPIPGPSISMKNGMKIQRYIGDV